MYMSVISPSWNSCTSSIDFFGSYLLKNKRIPNEVIKLFKTDEGYNVLKGDVSIVYKQIYISFSDLNEETSKFIWNITVITIKAHITTL
jgi:hypothetical protein